MIRYRRDVRATDQAAIDATVAHIKAHLSSVADSDDDPYTRADDVAIVIEPHAAEPGMVSITGVLDAVPDAPYLRPEYQPDADHITIRFQPFEQPAEGRLADYPALVNFRRQVQE